MKLKTIIIYGTILFLVAIVTISGTYAYLRGEVKRQKVVEFNTHQLQVIYSGAEPIEGELDLVRNKEEGTKRELSIGLDESSLPAKARFFLYAEIIDEGLASKGFKWEIYEKTNGEETYINSGTFEGLTSQNKMYLNDGLLLSTTTRKFIVYLWPSGYEIGNEAKGAKLIGYIGAETEPLTGNVS